MALSSAITQTDYGWSEMVHTLQCPECNYQTLRGSAFKEHCMRSHQNLSSVFVYSCPLCRACSTDIRLIAEHKLIYHTSESIQSIHTRNTPSSVPDSAGIIRSPSRSPRRPRRSQNRSVSIQPVAKSSDASETPRRSSRLRTRCRSFRYSPQSSRPPNDASTPSTSAHPQSNISADASSNVPPVKLQVSEQSDDNQSGPRRTSRKSSIKAIAAMTAAIVSITAPDSPVSERSDASPMKEERSARERRRPAPICSPSVTQEQKQQLENDPVVRVKSISIDHQSPKLSPPTSSRTKRTSVSSLPASPEAVVVKRRRVRKRTSEKLVLASTATSDQSSTPVVIKKSSPGTDVIISPHRTVVKTKSPARRNDGVGPVRKRKSLSSESSTSPPQVGTIINAPESESGSFRPVKHRVINNTKLCTEVQSHMQHLYDRGVRRTSAMITNIRDFVLKELRPPGPIEQQNRTYFPSAWTVRRLMKIMNQAEGSDVKIKDKSELSALKRRRIDLDPNRPLKSEPRNSCDATAPNNSSPGSSGDSVGGSYFSKPTTSAGVVGSSAVAPINISQGLLMPHRNGPSQTVTVKIEETRMEMVRCVKCGVRIPFQSDGTRACQDAALMAHLSTTHGIRKREPIVYPSHQQSVRNETGTSSSGSSAVTIRRHTASDSGHVTDLDAAELSPEESPLKNLKTDLPMGLFNSSQVCNDVRIMKERRVRAQRPVCPVKMESADLQVTATRLGPSCGQTRISPIKRPPAEDSPDVQLTTIRLRGPQPNIKVVPRDEENPVEATATAEEQPADVDIDEQQVVKDLEVADVKRDIEQTSNDQEQSTESNTKALDEVEGIPLPVFSDDSETLTSNVQQTDAIHTDSNSVETDKKQETSTILIENSGEDSQVKEMENGDDSKMTSDAVENEEIEVQSHDEKNINSHNIQEEFREEQHEGSVTEIENEVELVRHCSGTVSGTNVPVADAQENEKITENARSSKELDLDDEKDGDDSDKQITVKEDRSDEVNNEEFKIAVDNEQTPLSIVDQIQEREEEMEEPLVIATDEVHKMDPSVQSANTEVEDLHVKTNSAVCDLMSSEKCNSVVNDDASEDYSIQMNGNKSIDDDAGHWQCDHCFAGFDDKEELKSHLLEIHEISDC